MTQTLTEKVKSQNEPVRGEGRGYRNWRSKFKVEPIFEPADKLQIAWRDRAFCLSYWTEAGLEKESLIQEVMDFLLNRKYFIVVDSGWSDWDLEVYRGLWSKAQIKLCSENHGGSKRLLRVGCALRMSQFATMSAIAYCLVIAVAIILGMPNVATIALVIGAINAAAILYHNFRLGWVLYHVLKKVAKKLHLLPIRAKNSQLAIAHQSEER